MIEKVVLDWLTSELTLPVDMEMPEDPPEELVLIDRTGGGRRDQIDSATIAFQSYGSSLYRAAEINEQVKAALDKLDREGSVSAKLNSDYQFNDITRNRYRYQAVYDFAY